MSLGSTMTCGRSSLVLRVQHDLWWRNSSPLSLAIGISLWTFVTDRACVHLLRHERPDFIIHTAAQPSHDKAATIPYDDFDVNAVGTMNVLVAARDFCRDAPFCFTSTNKVYGDGPNSLPLVELRQTIRLCQWPGRHQRIDVY